MIVNYHSPNRRNDARLGYNVGDVNGPPPWRIPKVMQRWLMCLLVMLSCLTGNQMFAQTGIANYSRTISTGNTYTPIVGTTLWTSWDSELSAAIPMGGTFTFGGANFTSCFIGANGAITFGTGSSTSTPLSSSTSYSGAISALGNDGGNSTAAGATPRISYLGTATEFIVQYTDHAYWYGRSTERLNFQIRLTFATGEINLVYGPCTAPADTGAAQVGLRGNSNTFSTNVNNLMLANTPSGTTCNWSNAVTGYSNSSTVLFNSSNTSVNIPNGLKITFNPGTVAPVRTFSSVTGITATGATVSWTAPSGATQYSVQYRVPGTCAWTNYSGNPVAATSVALTGLSANTSYQVRVRAENATTASQYSHIPNAAGTGDGYTTTGTFTTLASCFPATALTATVTSNVAATLNWTAPTTAPSAGYQWEVRTSGAAGSGASGLVQSGTSATTTASVAGLTGNTAYSAYVRSNCGAGDFSTWTSASAFTTAFLGTLPWSESFATTTLPAGWSNPTPVWTIGTTTAIPAIATNYIRRNLSSSTTTAQFSTGSYGPVVSGQELSFDYALANASSPYAPPTGSWGTIQVQVSTNFGGTWATLATINDAAVSGWVNRTFPLSAYVGQNVSFRFIGTRTSGDFQMAFDNLSVDAPSSCTAVSGFGVSGVISSGATLSWSANALATSGYEYEVRTSGLPGSGATGLGPNGIIPGTSVNLTSLTANTNYVAYIRSVCGGSSSAWRQVAFKTTVAGDLCAEAISLTCGSNITVSLVNSTNEAMAVCGISGVTTQNSAGIWFKFTGNGDDTTISTGNTDPSVDTRLAVYSGSCGTLTCLGGNDDISNATPANLRSQVFLPTTVGTEYYVLLYSYSGTTPTGNIVMSMTCTPVCNPATTNDDCATAAPVTVGTPLASNNSCSFASAVSYPSCASSFGTYYDTWYSFNSGTNTSLEVSAVGISPAAVSYAIYTGACGSLVQQFCNNTPGTAATHTVVANTNYFVRVYSLSTGARGNFTLTVKVPCVNATGISFSAVTPTTATISWTASTSNPSGGYEYEIRSTGAAGSGSEGLAVQGTTAAGVVTANIVGLTKETAYRIYVRAVCGTGDFSAWSSGTAFTTPPSCYVPTAVTATGATPTTVNAAWTAPATGTPQGYEYEVRSSGAAGSGATGLAAQGTTAAGVVTANIGGLVQDTAYRLYVRSVCGTSDFSTWTSGTAFTTPPSCFKPTALNASAITNSTANVSWTAPTTAPAVGYQYAVTTSSTPPASGTATTTANGSVSGLTSNTQHYLHVRSVCVANEDFSNWVTYSFRTACDPASVPYVENFDSLPAPAFPECTVVQNPGSGNEWIVDEIDILGFSSQALIYVYDEDFAANTWWHSRGINLEAGKSYTISYTYSGTGTDYPERMRVAYGTAQSAAAMTNILATHANITLDTATPNSVIFSVPTTGIYYFGFQAYSARNRDLLVVDDISVIATPLTVTTFTPTTICSAGIAADRTVVITGYSFTDATSVTFNGVAAQSFVINSPTQITAIAPAGVTSGTIVVASATASSTSTESLAVTPSPVVNPIQNGDEPLCVGDAVQLSNPSPGGTWSSSDESIATVEDGVVTSVGPGEVEIRYSVTDLGCTTVVTKTIVVNEPVLVSNPATQTVVTGDASSFSVTATGAVQSYQWMVSTDEGNTFQNVENESPYSGAQTATLSISATPDTFNGYLYMVVVTAASPCLPVESAPATLNVGNTGITGDPASQTVCSSSIAATVFTVVPSGEVDSYSWEEDQGLGFAPIADGSANGLVYSGTGTAQLSVSGFTAINSGWAYRAKVQGPANGATSNAASVTVVEGVSVQTAPASTSNCYSSGSATFSVVANGAVAGYQWQYSTDGVTFANVVNNTPTGATYTNATSASMTVATTAATPASGTYFYRVVISSQSPCGPVESTNAQLSIFTPQVTTAPSAATVLYGNSTTLTVASSSPGATYQWQYAATLNGTYANVVNNTPSGLTYENATTGTLTVNASAIAAPIARYYRAVITSGGCSLSTAGALLTIQNYCIPAATASTNSRITQFTTTGGVTNLSNASAFSAGGYANYIDLSASVYQGQPLSFSTTTAGGSSGMAIWIDYNNNLSFEAGERVFNTTGYGNSQSGTFTVPVATAPGSYRMRVLIDFNSLNPTNSCGFTGATPRGEVEDYTLTVLQIPQCNGTPTAGTAVASATALCISGVSTLSVSGYQTPVVGQSFQWYNVATGLIPDATGTTYTTPTLTASASYFVRVTCTNSGLFSDSNTVAINVTNPVVATIAPATRCGAGTVTLGATAPAGQILSWYTAATGGSPVGSGESFTTPAISATTSYYVSASSEAAPLAAACASTSTSTSYYITGFSTTGALRNITNTGTVQSASGYGNYTAMSASQVPGGSVNFSVTWPSSTYGVSVFIDWNNDGDFDDAGEKVAGTASYVSSPYNTSFTVPAGTSPGAKRMRVKADFSVGSPLACSNSTSQETEDYTFMVPCESARTEVVATINAAPALAISASSASICAGASTSVNVTSALSDFDSYVWTPSTGVSGTAATGFTFNPTTTTTYTLTASQSGGSQCVNTATFAVTVNSLPVAPVFSPASVNMCSTDGPVQISSTAINMVALSENFDNNAPAWTITSANDSPVATNWTFRSVPYTETSGIADFSNFTTQNGGKFAIANSDLGDFGDVTNTILTSPSFSTLSMSSPQLTFEQVYHYISDDVTVKIEVSVNNGSTWTTLVSQLGTSVGTTTNNAQAMANSSFDMTAYANQPNVKIRFNYASEWGFFWAIDNVRVVNQQTPAVAFTPVAGLFTDAAGTQPYSGGAVTSVYAKPAQSTVYTATTTSSAGCSTSVSYNVNVTNATVWYVDADGDGYGTATLPTVIACTQPTTPTPYAAVAGDCDDSAGAIHPGQADVPFNGVDDNCDGVIDETSRVYSQVLASQCGTTLTSISSVIGAVSYGAPFNGYRFKVVNTATGAEQTIDRTAPNFSLSQLASYDYATTYSISVMLRRNGIWLNYYGPACLVSTPAILDPGGSAAVSPSQCGATLNSISTLIATTSIPGVTGYRFRVTNMTDDSNPHAVQTIERSINFFALTMLTRFNYGTEYQIEVAVKTNGNWSGYGAPCNVFSPAVPTLNNCGASIASPSTLIATTSLNRVQAYRFEITNMTSFEQITVDRSQNFFSFAQVPNFVPGALYGVRVSVQTSGHWSPYGEACEITAPGAARSIVNEEPAQAAVNFRAVVYPNPYVESFALDMDTSSEEDVQVKVYDMVGKLLEDRQFPIDQIEMQQFGERYPSGVYNIVVTQSSFVKTLRVIKR
ncbi:fibronectin type III domain-containing protein [Flavobacterium selenitireducens]|uniref:fibronectin type III domain-containing protein n=1 Tax=Flavobacterium selenitireducens TaxID=2722704 RepID=UPI00168A60E9|nr:fibronectin type III domain-containing protein [Flavobacterium selenitireducens]MBD3582703.1 T9SS type A sorting domain-containing protein [Flavobacterium selenitireducens]